MVPVVAAFGGPGDIVNPTVGYRVALTNPDDMVSQIQRILLELDGDDARLRRLSQDAVRYAREEWMWDGKARDREPHSRVGGTGGALSPIRRHLARNRGAVTRSKDYLNRDAFIKKKKKKKKKKGKGSILGRWNITGTFLRTARLAEEWYHDLEAPDSFIENLKRAGRNADLLTFWQRLPDTEPRYSFRLEVGDHRRLTRHDLRILVENASQQQDSESRRQGQEEGRGCPQSRVP